MANPSTSHALRTLLKEREIQSKDLIRLLGHGSKYLSDRMLERVPWSLSDVYILCDCLDIPWEEIPVYFPRRQPVPAPSPIRRNCGKTTSMPMLPSECCPINPASRRPCGPGRKAPVQEPLPLRPAEPFPGVEEALQRQLGELAAQLGASQVMVSFTFPAEGGTSLVQ